MHHKRKRARSRRAGCKLCKPWKKNGVSVERADGEKFSDHIRRYGTKLDLTDYWNGRARVVLNERHNPAKRPHQT